MPTPQTSEFSLQKLLQDNISLNYTCVVYRLPQQSTANFCAGDLVEIKGNLPENARFIISEFAGENNAIYALSGKCFNTITIENQGNIGVLEIPETKLPLPQSMPKEKYTGIVQKAVNEIEAGKLEKVVLSHPQKISLPLNFSAINLFTKLCQKYPDAFVYLLLNSDWGNWAGATPELLLQTKDKNLQTVALAGTRHISTDQKMLQPTDIFSPKEIHEQAVVTEYISSVLQPFSYTINTTATQLKKAGNLYHLQTTFSALLKDKNWLPVVKKLHPTPAVGGIPLNKAKAFITENENYDRSLYSGFLGPLDDAGNAQLFVNLRCMQFNQEEAVLYVGAGIVKGSEPEKEWQETQHKMRTLLDVLEN